MADISAVFDGGDNATMYVGGQQVLATHVGDNPGGGGVTGDPSPNLWFAKSDSLLGGTKKVFAHWFPPFPDHIDNPASRDLTYYAKQYFTINGESGSHAAEGGYLDNGPLWPGQFTVPNAQGQSLETQDGALDIQRASSYGYDGFVVDVITKNDPQHARYVGLLNAASALAVPGFYVIAMIDCNGSIVNSITDVANALDLFWGRPSTFMMAGKMVVSSFKGEGETTAWWQSLITEMSNRGHPICLWLSFLNYGSAANYTSVTIGEGAWGEGSDPATTNAISNRAATSHSRGKLYLHPIQGQSVRRDQNVWEESIGLTGHFTHWDRVVSEQPDAVQVVTWNDYSEGGESAPSEARGFIPLAIDCYRMHEYKMGKLPAILADELIIAHPSMKRATMGSQQTSHMNQWSRGLPRTTAQDIVQVTCFLKSAATVQVTVGGVTTSHNQPAGHSTIQISLAVGSPPSATAVRNGQTVAQVTSVAPVVASPLVDDRQYYLTSAINQASGLGAGQRVSVQLT